MSEEQKESENINHVTDYMLSMSKNEIDLMKLAIISAVKLDDDPIHLKEHLLYTYNLDRNTAEIQQLHMMIDDMDKLKKEFTLWKHAVKILAGAVVLAVPTAFQEALKILFGA